MSAQSQPKIVAIRVADIIVPKGRRATDPARVKSLAASMKANGQLQPVAVTGDNRLIFGAHRLEAAKLLGLEYIQAIVLDLGDLRTELCEIDENIERNPLTKLELSKALTRRKELYEAMNPTAKSVTKRGGPGRGKKTSDKLSSVSFARDTAAKTGKSPRTIERAVETGEKLDADAAEMLRGTPVENNQRELKAIADLPSEKQKEVAAEIKAGKMASVRAKKNGSGEPKKAEAGLKALKALADALGELGILDAHANAIRQIKAALKEIGLPKEIAGHEADKAANGDAHKEEEPVANAEEAKDDAEDQPDDVATAATTEVVMDDGSDQCEMTY